MIRLFGQTNIMAKLYFIDSENVGDFWIPLLNYAAPEDLILVFYTAKSPHMNYKSAIALKRSNHEVEFIECCEGANALDFQLCTELGYRVHALGQQDYVIVTNDTGFDAVVRYWRKRNFSIKRITGKECSQLSRALEKPQAVMESVKSEEKSQPIVESTKSEEKAQPIVESAKSEEKAQPVVESAKSEEKAQPIVESAKPEEKTTKASSDEGFAKELLYLVGKKDLQLLHAALQQFFGSKQAQAYYTAFKTDHSYQNFLNSHPQMNLQERVFAYYSLIFTLSDTRAEMPKDLPTFATKAWTQKKNLNSLRASLQGKYGKEQGSTCYSLIKNHMKIVTELKERSQ